MRGVGTVKARAFERPVSERMRGVLRGVLRPAAAALFALLATPSAALACAVCFQAQTDESRVAFIATAAGLTAMPLLLILGLAWWVRKQFREAQR